MEGEERDERRESGRGSGDLNAYRLSGSMTKRSRSFSWLYARRRRGPRAKSEVRREKRVPRDDPNDSSNSYSTSEDPFFSRGDIAVALRRPTPPTISRISRMCRCRCPIGSAKTAIRNGWLESADHEGEVRRFRWRAMEEASEVMRLGGREERDSVI